jgi:ethanolamine utilization microcompartment shell protein EutL
VSILFLLSPVFKEGTSTVHRLNVADALEVSERNSNEVEYDKSPNAGTGSIPAQHGEELNFNKGENPAEKRSSLHLFLQSSKEYLSLF